MKRSLRILLVVGLVFLAPLPNHAQSASSEFKRGMRAEAHQQYDAAFEAYKQAYILKPKDAKYAVAYLRMREAAALEHVKEGQKLLAGNLLNDALAEFQEAAEIDPTNFIAVGGMRRTEILIRRAEAKPKTEPSSASSLVKLAETLEGPLRLQPSPDTPITLRMTANADSVYRTIGKLGGINVLFDADYKPQRITIELNAVKMEEAFKLVAIESKTLWRPISPTSILVAAETKRKDMESSVMKTFYLSNVSSPNELQEVVGTLKGMLDVSRIQVNPTHSTITLRCSPDQMVLAEKLISEFDKPKSEVVIDVAVLQVSRDRLRTLGTVLPTSTTVGPAAAAGTVVSGSGLVQIASLAGNSIVTPIPSATLTALMSDDKTKVLQNPEIRALNDEKSSLRIGDRVPIATGSYTPGGGVSVSPLINTQFQYLDVGVNIDITPHIHSDQEVTLKMSLEISSVTGSQNIGGINQPVIGQRRIEHETRLEDGEVNLIGGILEDSETHSLSGYPLLENIPILKYLFGQENAEHTENEIVFAITPHIVRAEDITDEDLKVIDVGSSGNIGLRYKGVEETGPDAKTTGSRSQQEGNQPAPNHEAGQSGTGLPGTATAPERAPDTRAKGPQNGEVRETTPAPPPAPDRP